MTVVRSKAPDAPETPETPEVPLTPPVSGRWIAMGSLAMLVGLLMGFIMSSLGK